MDILRKNIGRLKDIFINLSSNSSYPCVTVLDFSTFAAKAKIFDKYVNIAAVDRAFIATNFKAKDQAEVVGNPGNALTRFEFLEILVRLAKDKYMPHSETTMTGCL